MRNTDLRWHAFRGRKNVDYIGTFTSEKGAALAHDFYARKAGDTYLINFPREQMSEKDMQKRKTKQYEGVTLPAKGKSIYRGVHLQKNRKRWMARYSLSHKKEKRSQPTAIQNKTQSAILKMQMTRVTIEALLEVRGRGPSCQEQTRNQSTIRYYKIRITNYLLAGK
jgi:hypothetical protein